MKNVLLVLVAGLVLAGCDGEKVELKVASAGNQAYAAKAKELEAQRTVHRLQPLTREQMGLDGVKKEGK